MYDLLLFVHVLAAAAWAGGAIYAFLLALAVRRTGDPQRAAGVGREFAEFSGKYFAPIAVVTILAGIGLVMEADIGFDHFWIASAFAVWIYSVVSNVTWLAKLSDRIGSLVTERGPTDPAVVAARQQMFGWRALEVLLLVYVIYAMTVKPFFG